MHSVSRYLQTAYYELGDKDKVISEIHCLFLRSLWFSGETHVSQKVKYKVISTVNKLGEDGLECAGDGPVLLELGTQGPRKVSGGTLMLKLSPEYTVLVRES